MKVKEIWKTIENFEDYQVSNLSRVKSLKFGKEKILKQGINNDGYYLVSLYKYGKGKIFRVHRLVAQAFIPNPQNLPIINHKDENKKNNMVSNLEWCTMEHNINYGTRNKRASKTLKGRKQSQEHIKKCAKAHQKPILQLSKSGKIILCKYNSVFQASKELNINCSNISKCLKGKHKTAKKYRWMYYDDYRNLIKFDFQLSRNLQ